MATNATFEKDASALFADHLELLTSNPEQWRQLYAPDAVMEFPYAPSIGAPARYEGRDAIFNHVQGVFSQLSSPRFTNIQIMPLEGDGSRSVGKFEISALVKDTGRTYNQKYVALLTASQGKIVAFEEYWNPHEVIKSFSILPGVSK
jgi:ketosteroid isomerase-like protein